MGEKGSVAKLMATLHRKKEYVVHYTYVKRTLREGLILEKIHRGVKFMESAWLKPYINSNTQLRQTATDPFTKDLCKLMNNAVFRKSMENVRNRRDLRITDNESLITKYVNCPEFTSRMMINKDTKELSGCASEYLVYKIPQSLPQSLSAHSEFQLGY